MNKGISYLDRPAELRDHILEVGAGHAVALRELMGVEEADLAVHVATVTDRVHHFFWHHIDPEHPAHAQAPAELGNPVFDGYRIAEASLEHAWSAAPWDAVLLVSDHGAGRSTISMALDVWLAEQELCRLESDRVDVSASLAYCGEEPECSIYVNRLDRDGCGVAPEAYGAFVEDLRTRLLALRTPTGTSAIDAALLQSELPGGLLADLGPDIVLVPADGVHPRPGPAARTFDRATRLYSGHRRDGLLVLVASGVRAQRAAEPMDMVDVFRLACRLLDIPEPAGAGGAAPVDLVSCGAPEDPSWDWAAQVAGAPARQARNEAVLHRLAELGYT